MKFGPFNIADAEGLILAHTLRAGGLVLKKGHVVTAADVAALQAAGVKDVIGARLEASDVGEDDAAGHIARRLAGAHVTPSAARTGRCNLIADADGVMLIDAGAVTAANLVSETVTIATLADKQAAKAGQIVATVKVIPFAVGADVMTALESVLGKGALALAPYVPKRFALISTLAPGLKPSVIASTEEVTRQRITALGGAVTSLHQGGHNAADVEREVRASIKQGAEVVLITGASATVDRGDVVPSAIVAAGGTIDHFGMPVDPGNLLVLAHIGHVSVLVLPGCARSPKLNGVDWVMQRLLAGIAVTPRDIQGMGVGGLLMEIPSRPLPRAEAARTKGKSRMPQVAAVILAAGRSSRFIEKNGGGASKLLAGIAGEAMIVRVVKAAIASQARPVVVVVGHQQAEVRAALAGLDVTFVENPHYAEGLSTSLKAGLTALPKEIDGALVQLGDMPSVPAATLDILIAAFNPLEGRAIVVPTAGGKRGNPVLWGRAFFDEMGKLQGDVGARHLIGTYPEAVAEVAMQDDGVLLDIDEPAALADFLKTTAAANAG